MSVEPSHSIKKNHLKTLPPSTKTREIVKTCWRDNPLLFFWSGERVSYNVSSIAFQRVWFQTFFCCFFWTHECCLPFSGGNYFVCRVKGTFWQFNSKTHAHTHTHCGRKVKGERDDKNVTLIPIKKKCSRKGNNDKKQTYLVLLRFFFGLFSYL